MEVLINFLTAANAVSLFIPSGGSFSVKLNGYWVSKGIVSIGNVDCDTNDYILYTKLSDFTEWIKNTVVANP